MHKRARLSAADRQRIGHVFETHRGFILALARQHVGRDHAGDVLAEVALRLCTSLNGLRQDDAIRTWLYRVTLSAVHDLRNAGARLERVREAIAVDAGVLLPVIEPDIIVLRRQRADALVDALNRMRSRDKSLICHSLDLGGVSVSSDAADRKALSRARGRLREALQQDPRFG